MTFTAWISAEPHIEFGKCGAPSSIALDFSAIELTALSAYANYSCGVPADIGIMRALKVAATSSAASDKFTTKVSTKTSLQTNP